MNSMKLGRSLLSLSVLLCALTGSLSAAPGTDTPTCTDLLSFEAELIGANSTCDQLIFRLTAVLDAFDDCLAPAAVIVVDAEDAVVAGAKVPVLVTPCQVDSNDQISFQTVVPFFSSGVIRFTYRIDQAVDLDCGEVSGTTTIALPDLATLQTSAAVEGLTAVPNGPDIDLSWTLPSYAGDGYRSISVERRDLFGLGAPGPYTCLALIPGNSLAFIDAAPPASPGSTGFEYRIVGILNPQGTFGAVNIATCDELAATAPGMICDTFPSTVMVQPSPSAILKIEECVIAPANTFGVEVPVLLSSAFHFGVTSVGIAVRHDSAELSACAAVLGGDVPHDIAFTTTAILSEGISAGLLSDFSVVPLSTIPVGVDLEVFRLCYNTLNAPGGTSSLAFAFDLPVPSGPPGVLATNEVFAIPDAGTGISQAILPPQLSFLDGSIKIESGGFIRGDFDGDGQVQIVDAIGILQLLFLAGTDPMCDDALDINDDDSRDILDAIVLLNFLFLSDEPPLSPFPACGPDPTPGALDCQITPPGCAPPVVL